VEHSTFERDLGPSPRGRRHAHHLLHIGHRECGQGLCAHVEHYSYGPRCQTKIHDFGRDDVELTASPIAHTTGLAFRVIKPLLVGGATCLMDVWEPQHALELIASRAAHIRPVRALYRNDDRRRRARSPSLETFRLFVCGVLQCPGISRGGREELSQL